MNDEILIQEQLQQEFIDKLGQYLERFGDDASMNVALHQQKTKYEWIVLSNTDPNAVSYTAVEIYLESVVEFLTASRKRLTKVRSNSLEYGDSDTANELSSFILDELFPYERILDMKRSDARLKALEGAMHITGEALEGVLQKQSDSLLAIGQTIYSIKLGSQLLSYALGIAFAIATFL